MGCVFDDGVMLANLYAQPSIAGIHRWSKNRLMRPSSTRHRMVGRRDSSRHKANNSKMRYISHLRKLVPRLRHGHDDSRNSFLTKIDVSYHERHVRWLMRESSVSWQTPRPRPTTADEEKRKEIQKDLKNLLAVFRTHFSRSSSTKPRKQSVVI